MGQLRARLGQGHASTPTPARPAFYKFADEPIIDTWADVYPDLFEDQEEMPARLREQVQYPPQLMHVQFDDVYIY